MHQSTFLFDYQAFRDFIGPVVHSLDQGNYAPLIEEAEKVFNDELPDNWILQDEGTSLERFDITEIANQSDVGYLLLVTLSRFLQKGPQISGWATQTKVLKDQFGWEKGDLDLLFFGNPTSTLLKPKAEQPKILSIDDPYWFWIHPTQSYRNGWLDIEQIQRLRDKLRLIENKILGIHGKSNNKIQMGDHEIAWLLQSYQEVMELFEVAERSGKGLFFIVSY